MEEFDEFGECDPDEVTEKDCANCPEKQHVNYRFCKLQISIMKYIEEETRKLAEDAMKQNNMDVLIDAENSLIRFGGLLMEEKTEED